MFSTLQSVRSCWRAAMRNLIWNTVVFPGRQTTYAFPVIVPTQHDFRVRACNIGGCSSASNQVSQYPN